MLDIDDEDLDIEEGKYEVRKPAFIREQIEAHRQSPIETKTTNKRDLKITSYPNEIQPIIDRPKHRQQHQLPPASALSCVVSHLLSMLVNHYGYTLVHHGAME